MRHWVCLAFVLLVGSIVRMDAQASLPSRAEVETAMQRSFGYDPSVNWVIYDIRQSPIPGVADILVSLNKQEPLHIFYSLEAGKAIVGNIIPFGANPFESTRAALRTASGPSRGAQQPAITLVAFSDLECPHCKTAEPVLEQLQKDFPQIRIVFEAFPLPASMHPWALAAAKFADCVARQNADAFWTFTDAVFDHQSEINVDNAEANLKSMATAAGVNADQAASCSAEAETGARLQHSLNLGMSLDVTETPTVFINGRRVLDPASIPYANLKRLVQFEVDHANR